MAGDHPNPQQIRPSFVGLLLAIVYSLTRLLHKMYITKPTQQLYILSNCTYMLKTQTKLKVLDGMFTLPPTTDEAHNM